MEIADNRIVNFQKHLSIIETTRRVLKRKPFATGKVNTVVLLRQRENLAGLDLITLKQ